ncbi:MAG: redox-regulated ATPase YchF [Candidatus Marinimicrobia bacterium]|nr:redox-regulated ATPase YchF [Candidatus Neomarinimicrobiota bacterium]
MQIGIVGLPYSGKSTIFSTLTHHKTEDFASKNKTEKGIVRVPDSRLDALAEIFQPRKKTETTIEYIKVPGLEAEEAASGSLPAQFIGNLKTVDAMLLMVRHFENEMYPHPFGEINPEKDIEFVNSEFLLSDLAILETRIEKLEKSVQKMNKPEEKKELEILLKCREHLENDQPLRLLELNPEEEKLIRGFQFLSLKPIVYVINIAEEDISKTEEIIKQHEALLTEKTALTALCAEIEKEISELEDEEQEMFMEEMGIKEPALNNVIRKSYELLGLISFLTVGEDECRSWTVKQGAKAPEAGGEIHSDIERGFIRATVVTFDEFMKHKSLKACKDLGVLRLEGREYVVQDGDIMEFRFNV